jgi:hypothetical protein
LFLISDFQTWNQAITDRYGLRMCATSQTKPLPERRSTSNGLERGFSPRSESALAAAGSALLARNPQLFHPVKQRRAGNAQARGSAFISAKHPVGFMQYLLNVLALHFHE